MPVGEAPKLAKVFGESRLRVEGKPHNSSLKSCNIRGRALHRVSCKCHFRDGVHAFLHGAALPVPIFIGLHFLEAGIRAD